ncbi:hypothetical protein J3459_012590 [Metarhizium acridum]|nr:hypothetical protein J3459_012590 [Metarhizium acridum]
MCNNDHGTPLASALKRSLHELLAFRVKRTSGFVEEQDVRVTDESSSDGYALLLAAGEGDSSRANICVVSFWEGDDKVVDGGVATGPVELFFRNCLVVDA